MNKKGVAGLAVMGVVWFFMISSYMIGRAHRAYIDKPQSVAQKTSQPCARTAGALYSLLGNLDTHSQQHALIAASRMDSAKEGALIYSITTYETTTVFCDSARDQKTASVCRRSGRPAGPNGSYGVPLQDIQAQFKLQEERVFKGMRFLNIFLKALWFDKS